MKFIILTVYMMCMGFIYPAHAATQNADSKITSVTVYNDRAEVTRSATINISKGEHTFAFNRLPDNMEKSSLHVDGTGSFSLKDIKHTTRQFKDIPDEARKKLYDKRDALKLEINSFKSRVTRINDSREFVNAITKRVTTQSDKETQPVLEPAKWKEMVAFYEAEMEKADKGVVGANAEILQFKALLDSVESQIRELSYDESKRKNTVLVTVLASKAGDININLTYMVYGPKWYPSYDIRVDSDNKKLNLTCYGNLTQNTGENWNDVKVKLSTAQPVISGQEPALKPWFIGEYQPRPQIQMMRKSGASANKPASQMMSADMSMSKAELAPAPEPAMEVITSDVESNTTSVLFAITGKSTIKSDNSPGKVTIMIKDFPAYFRYSTVPKLSPYAYLKAKVTNTTEYPFLPGETHIFLNNNFVANARMEAVAPTEEFWTSLGVEQGIKIEYKLVRRFQDNSGIISKKVKTIYEYLIKIKNNKKTEEELVVWDQLPISNHEDIMVEILNPKYQKDNAYLKMNEHKFLEWKFKPKAGQEMDVPFSFSVEHPRKMRVEGL